MAEVKLMRNGVYVSGGVGVICGVKDGEYRSCGLTYSPGCMWFSLFKGTRHPASQVIWTEDTLVLPEEYLT